MTGFLNYYGRNPFPSDDWTNYFDFMGYAYLGPMFIPPVIPAVGMTDRNGTGVVYYLMWDGETHLLLTDVYPMAYPTEDGPGAQNVTIFGPWDGPYMTSGFRLGVTTASQGPSFPSGVPRLQFDVPGNGNPGTQVYTEGGPPIFAPYILGPQLQTYPEPSNYPAPGVPTVPGIPSSTPPPTGGGLQAFYAAASTNTPPVVVAANVTTVPTFAQPGWHLQHLGG